MIPYDLKTEEGLRDAAAEAERSQLNKEWRRNLKAMLLWVKNIPVEDRATVGFQQRLWDENDVAAVGQGNISVEAALADEAFRRWVAEQSVRDLPTARAERVLALTELYDQM